MAQIVMMERFALCFQPVRREFVSVRRETAQKSLTNVTIQLVTRLWINVFPVPKRVRFVKMDSFAPRVIPAMPKASANQDQTPPARMNATMGVTNRSGHVCLRQPE